MSFLISAFFEYLVREIMGAKVLKCEHILITITHQLKCSSLSFSLFFKI